MPPLPLPLSLYQLMGIYHVITELPSLQLMVCMYILLMMKTEPTSLPALGCVAYNRAFGILPKVSKSSALLAVQWLAVVNGHLDQHR